MLPSEIDNRKHIEIEDPGGTTPIHSALWEEPCLKWPNPARSSIIAWGQKAIERWNITQRPFDRNPGITRCGSRFALCLLACATPCPGRVLAQSLSAVCYASYGVQLSLCRISALQARSRMHYHEGMHLLFKGISVRPALGTTICCSFREQHIFPCHQSFIGTLSPRHTHHPNAWRAKLTI